MPILPSGRRIEFSLDRFHAMLEMLPPKQVQLIDESLQDPRDLLWILDMVSFDGSGQPHFAECVAADWSLAATDWNPADRDALGSYLNSDIGRNLLERGLDGTRTLVLQRLATDRGALNENRCVA